VFSVYWTIALIAAISVSRSFKLDNRLREAEPKIKKIGDYEQQIDNFEENQLLWCVQNWLAYASFESWS
jgi:hypothetical protein